MLLQVQVTIGVEVPNNFKPVDPAALNQSTVLWRLWLKRKARAELLQALAGMQVVSMSQVIFPHEKEYKENGGR
jgi:hypothetical protein